MEIAAGAAAAGARRPVGAGLVWVDASQYVFVLIAPRRHAPQNHDRKVIRRMCVAAEVLDGAQKARCEAAAEEVALVSTADLLAEVERFRRANDRLPANGLMPSSPAHPRG